ncbi:MAG: helix-hairpin-helix domain-containing protein [Candidatus Cloacimonetes bacterium]|nr:helix-hairpin-helix domain-containing protein [Candidatus Cloacimonadota bacterium]
MKLFLRNYFSPAEQKILLFLAFFLLLGSVLKLAGYEPANTNDAMSDSLKVALAEDAQLKIDIRTAGERELMALSGIGEKRARDIIAFREAQPFINVKDLLSVPGIGPKTYAKIFPNLVVFGDTLIVQSAQSQGQTASSQSEAKVNINTAGIEELSTLSGIGSVKAQAIIDYRTEHGPFTTAEDITKVKGIGKITLQKNLHRISL